MYHRVCRIDPPGNVTESVVMFYLDDSFFFVRLVFLEMLHSSQCSCSAPVASSCQTERCSSDVSEEWYSIMIRWNAFYLGAFHIRHSFTFHACCFMFTAPSTAVTSILYSCLPPPHGCSQSRGSFILIWRGRQRPFRRAEAYPVSQTLVTMDAACQEQHHHARMLDA